jgi:hypothetical protein
VDVAAPLSAPRNSVVVKAVVPALLLSVPPPGRLQTAAPLPPVPPSRIVCVPTRTTVPPNVVLLPPRSKSLPVLSLMRLTVPVPVRFPLILPTAPVPLIASVLVAPAAALTRVLKKTVPVPVLVTAPPFRLIEPPPSALLPREPTLIVPPLTVVPPT